MSARATKKPAAAAKRAAKKPANRKAPSKNKGGRPSKYTEDLAVEIIERISEGEPLAQIVRDGHMPGLRTVYDWMERDAEFSARIARAREAGFDMIAQEALRIADTPVEGVVEKMEPDKEGGDLVVVERRREDMLGHRKLQVETRLKLLAKWDPRRYGDRLTHAGDAESPVTVVVRRSGHD